MSKKLEAVMLALVLAIGVAATPVAAQTVNEPPSVTYPGYPQNEACPKGNRGGAIAGIVVASVFFALLPMSIPVLVTQGKKLKKHNKAMREGRCGY
ncbi:MAG: hypothetical protein AMJ62_12210 [Myxococcales bacterium SG8_38]|nr:MAG: hypothetical protein AMJ62_12210 [Myxococcales bacterium SG8_38]